MTVGTMVDKDAAAGSDRIRLFAVGIDALAISLRDIRQPRAIGGGE